MSRINHTCLPALCLLPLLLCLNGMMVQGQQKTLTAAAILNRAARNYAGFSSYQDVGTVETTYDEGMSGHIERMPFKIYFTRPNLFRFEWTDFSSYKDGRTNVVWSNGKESFSYWEPDRHEKEESLGMGIAGASGVSSGSAQTIPYLLMAQMSGFNLTKLTKLSLVGTETFDDELCYRINGRSLGSMYEIWISKRDFLVRKVRTRIKFDTYLSTKEEIHRAVKVNAPIAREVFNFRPPIALKTPKEDSPAKPFVADENPAWSEFYSEEGRFKILLPTKPTTQTLSMKTPQGELVHHGFTASKGGSFCIIDYTDVPKLLASPENMNTIFTEARDAFLKQLDGKLAGESTISLDGHPGREIKVDLRGGEAKARFYMVNERFYQLIFMGISFLDESTGEMNKYFDSFKLVGDTKSIAGLPLLKNRNHSDSSPRRPTLRLTLPRSADVRRAGAR